jgi:uncharacterized protein RhaS with RHS repeats
MKNNILLMAAVAFFTALNVQAYFDPSVGRWASRDPAGEDMGELNLYGFVSNDSLDNFDEFGLMSRPDVVQVAKDIDDGLKTIKCCCKRLPNKVVETISGTASGTTVTGKSQIDIYGCVDSKYYVYWWDCYTAHEQAKDAGGILNEINFLKYGWSAGGTTYSKTAAPGWFAWTGAGDPYHLAMDSMVVFIFCGGDGFKHASYQQANELQWTWNKKTKSWTGPSSNR